MQSIEHKQLSSLTLYDLGAAQLTALCSAAGIECAAPLELFGRLAASWADAEIGQPPPWPSVVGDDHTPFELSVSLGPSPEVRLLVEPLGAVPSARENRGAAIELLESLWCDLDLDLERLDAVADLFLPDSPLGSFGIGVAVGFSAARPPQLKLYLDATAQGAALAPAIVEEALARLGMAASWPVVARGLLRRGAELDQLKYVSLDLSRSPTARVKVYATHQQCSAVDLEAAASWSSGYRAGQLTGFLQAMAPGVALFDRRPALTCFAFVEDHGRRPATVTTHLPVNSYALSDRVIADRVIAYLEPQPASRETYTRCLAAHVRRPLASGVGLQSYVSFAQHHERTQLTVYLAAEAYAPGTIAAPPAARPPATPSEIVERFEQRDQIVHHPYLRRLRREPVNLHHVWMLLANFQISISKHFAGWLAAIAGRVPDDRVRCILAEQLYDEMGRGRFADAHINLFAHMMLQLEPWRSTADAADYLAPGRKLVERIAKIYGSPDIGEALGAVILGEIVGKQMDQFLGDELRRQAEVDPSSLTWLTLHEQLEVEHADASAQLAVLLPDELSRAAWHGASGLFDAGTAFLNQLYELCYCAERNPD